VQETCLEAHFLVMQGCACEVRESESEGARAARARARRRPAVPTDPPKNNKTQHKQEEDFNVHLVGLPLEAAAAEMCAAPYTQRGRKATADCLAKLTAAADALGKHKKSSNAVAQALVDRLLFRRDLLKALSAFRGKQKADLAAAAKALGELGGRVASLRASSGLAVVEAAGGEGKEAEPAAAAVPGFVPTLNNHLTPPTPPRQLKVRSDRWIGPTRIDRSIG
jgi:hypothetical protein